MYYNVQIQKVSRPTHWTVTGNWVVVSTAKLCKGMYEAKLELPDGWGMDIF